VKKYLILLIILFIGCSKPINDTLGSNPISHTNQYTFDIQYIGNWDMQLNDGSGTLSLSGSNNITIITNIDSEIIEFWVKKTDVLISPLILKINYMQIYETGMNVMYSRHYFCTTNTNYIGLKL